MLLLAILSLSSIAIANPMNSGSSQSSGGQFNHPRFASPQRPAAAAAPPASPVQQGIAHVNPGTPPNQVIGHANVGTPPNQGIGHANIGTPPNQGIGHGNLATPPDQGVPRNQAPLGLGRRTGNTPDSSFRPLGGPPRGAAAHGSPPLSAGQEARARALFGRLDPHGQAHPPNIQHLLGAGPAAHSPPRPQQQHPPPSANTPQSRRMTETGAGARPHAQRVLNMDARPGPSTGPGTLAGGAGPSRAGGVGPSGIRGPRVPPLQLPPSPGQGSQGSHGSEWGSPAAPHAAGPAQGSPQGMAQGGTPPVSPAASRTGTPSRSPAGKRFRFG